MRSCCLVLRAFLCLSPALAQQPLAFEVASVKPAEPGATFSPNFPLDSGDSFVNLRTKESPNGRFWAVSQLHTYISFAWKLRLAPGQTETMLAHLPGWVSTDAFEIRARASGNPTKDQMRLMMQSLLAERFRLALHFETREVPVYALTLVKPGKTGTRLRPHAEGLPCDASPAQDPMPVCDVISLSLDRSGQWVSSSRSVTMARIASALQSVGSLDRPVIDATGLTGKFDYVLKWAPYRPIPDPDADNPTFLQALREQLGLKLESTRRPVETPVIDHVERPL